MSESVEIDGVTIRYVASGDGPPIVFVHGVYVGGALWAPLVERITGFRCIVPTWPLGAHADPAPDADLSATAIAARIPALLEALDLTEVTLVANDTGGGLTLAALGSAHPGLSRIRRLVLTNCDSYEHFPPEAFARLVRISRQFPRFGACVIRLMASRIGRKAFLKSVCRHRPKGEAGDRVFEAFATSRAARKDALRTTLTLEPAVTLDAVPALRAFDKPVLLAWGDRDRFFPVTHAERLRQDFPDARLRVIEHASTFVMLDQPDQLARLISEFVAETS